MLSVLQNITKNQAFTCILTGFNNDNYPTALTVFKISKNGGVFTALTNTPSVVSSPGDFFGNLAYTVSLTASEMNADQIVVMGEDVSSPFGFGCLHIYTTTSTPISTAHEIDADEKIPAGDITVMQVLGLLAKRLKRGNYKI